MPETSKQGASSVRVWGSVTLFVGLHVLIGGTLQGEDVPRRRHAHLGSSPVEANAIYGLPAQEKIIPRAADGSVRIQRVYKAATGQMVEVWFGRSGAEAILIPGETDPKAIQQLLFDSAADGTWERDKRIWRRSDGAAVAAIMRQKSFFIGTAPWLVKAVEAEAHGDK